MFFEVVKADSTESVVLRADDEWSIDVSIVWSLTGIAYFEFILKYPFDIGHLFYKSNYSLHYIL